MTDIPFFPILVNMEPIELPHCTVFDAGSTPYIKKSSITSVYPEYLVLGKDDCIEFLADDYLASVTGVLADYEPGRKGPNLIVMKLNGEPAYPIRFRMNYADKWTFQHGSFRTEYIISPSASIGENLKTFEKAIRKVQAHLENWHTGLAIDSLEGI